MSKTANIFIFCLLLALLSMGGYAYGVSYISGLSEKTTAAKRDVEAADLRYRNILSLEKAARDAGDENSQINDFLVQPDAAIDFVSRIEVLASGFGLSYSTDGIETRSVGELDSQGKELLAVSFTASGRWSSIVRLVKMIESLPYAVQFEKLDLVMIGQSNPVESQASTSPASFARERSWKASLIFTAVKLKDK